MSVNTRNGWQTPASSGVWIAKRRGKQDAERKGAEMQSFFGISESKDKMVQVCRSLCSTPDTVVCSRRADVYVIWTAS